MLWGSRASELSGCGSEEICVAARSCLELSSGVSKSKIVCV